MTGFEYTLPLVSVLVGLAITDLAISLHRLLRSRKIVKWDWLPLVSMLLALFSVLEVWWRFYATQNDIFYTTLGGFLPLAGQLIILFLINAAALPDNVPDEGLDLKKFYENNGPYFWSLFSVYVLFVILIRIAKLLQKGLPSNVSLSAFIFSLVFTFAILMIYILLARFRNRKFHAIAVISIIIILLIEWWNLELELG